MTRAFKAILQRECLCVFRHAADVVLPLLFFVLVVMLFPLAINPEPQLLQTIGPGIIWVAALLANLFAIDRLYGMDYLDGSLEQLLLSPYPLSLLVFAKVFAHWVLSAIPFIVLTPLLCVMLGLTSDTMWTLVLSLLLGTPALCFVSSIAMALTVGLRGGRVLLALLVLPLMVPVLILGAGASMNPVGSLSMLAAILAFSASLAPWASAGALRIRMS